MRARNTPKKDVAGCYRSQADLSSVFHRKPSAQMLNGLFQESCCSQAVSISNLFSSEWDPLFGNICHGTHGSAENVSPKNTGDPERTLAIRDRVFKASC